MTNYKICPIGDSYQIHRLMDGCVAGWFNGYDEMGTALFGDCDPDNGMDLESAKATLADLEAAEDEQEDPMIEKFQRILNCAVADRDYQGAYWKRLADNNYSSDLSCHSAYIRYQQAQGYLEGLTTAIFAAGYNILSAVDSTKLTVTK